MVKGYKAFNNDWKCRGFQYEVGKTYEMDGDIEVCRSGFHFCENLANCFDFYDFADITKIAEVEAYGEVETDGVKSVTNKIKIVREMSWDEVLKACNTGNRNTGNRNTGNWNTGNWNTGDWNTGNWNTGNWNTGNWNTGDWNKSNFNTGCFNTVEQKIMLFNRPSDLTYQDWIDSKARRLLNQIPKNVVEWICAEEMTDEEKAENPTYKTTGGYLKVLDESECAQIWWDGLDEDDRDVIKAIPNFDADVFFECTGIRV